MKVIDRFLIRFFLSLIIFLLLGIMCKINVSYYKVIHYYLYEDSFNFNSIYDFYSKYLGGISFFYDDDNIKTVMKNDLKYNSFDVIDGGIKLNVDNHYLVPLIYDGVVINKLKNNIGNVLVIQNSDVNVWYGNICNSSLKLFDSLVKGDYVGESCDNTIYIFFEKDGKFLNYKDYFNY